MRKGPKNYDSPFYESDYYSDFNTDFSSDFDVYLDDEDIHNEDFVENIPVYPPRGSFTNLPANVFLISDSGIAETYDSYEDLQSYKDNYNQDY